MTRLLAATAFVFLATQIQAAEPQLAHIVFFTLSEDTNENRETLVAACRKYLSDHDGTVYFSAGTINEELDRDVNDQNFDVALHLVFANRKHHDTYQTDPRHLRFIDENKHLWSAVRVFDSNVAAPSQDGISAGGKGFAGMLTGRVVSKAYGQVVLQVMKIDQVWRQSEAANASELVGRKIVVAGRDGAPNIHRLIGLLKVGETVTVDVAHKKDDSLTILELTEDQRERISK